MKALVLGVFDGVHMGHRRLIEEAGLETQNVIACTFERNPKSDVFSLLTAQERKELLLKNGVTEVYMQDFDKIKDISAKDYIENLCRKFSPGIIAAGFNHHFGRGALGNIDTLKQLEKDCGYKTLVLPPFVINRQIVSSSRIRQLLLSGKADEAKELLGYYYFISGTTVHGRHLGSKIGFPTINTQVTQNKLVPQRGVYASVCTVNKTNYKAITNIGENPTVSDENRITVETFVLGFSQDVYGKDVKISFLKKLRDEQNFGSIERLKQQLGIDAMVSNGFIRQDMLDEI